MDSMIPSGFAPFNIAYIGGNIWVTYAKQDAMKHDDEKGPENGFIDVFTPAGALVSAGSDGESHGLFGFLRPQHPNPSQH